MVLPREEGENEACFERKQSKKIEFLIKRKKQHIFAIRVCLFHLSDFHTSKTIFFYEY
jgi:hypothetical protein